MPNASDVPAIFLSQPSVAKLHLAWIRQLEHLVFPEGSTLIVTTKTMEKKQAKKKTAKLAREERIKGRELKIEELSREYDRTVRLMKRYEKNRLSTKIDKEGDDFVWFHASYEELVPKDKFIAEGIKKWESEQEVFVSGIYKDENWLRANVQRQFMLDLRICRRAVFAELRKMETLFKAAFGKGPFAYEKIFNNFSAYQLYDYPIHAKSSIERIIGEIEGETNETRSWIKGDWRGLIDHTKGFRWHDLRLLFLVIGARASVSRGMKPSKQISTIARWVASTLRFPDFGPMASKSSTSSDARKRFDALGLEVATRWVKGKEPYFVAIARREIQRLLEVDSPDRADALAAFMLQIDDWAIKHCLEKDWILRFACYLLDRQVHESLNIMTCDLPVLQDWSLYTEPFKFEFDRWFPGFEKKESYEKRLRTELHGKLHQFFQDNGRRLNLDRGAADNCVKAVTRRPAVKNIRYLLAWNEGATLDQIVDAIAAYLQDMETSEMTAMFVSLTTHEANTVEKGIESMRDFDLPKRQGRHRGRPVSDERIYTILSIEGGKQLSS